MLLSSAKASGRSSSRIGLEAISRLSNVVPGASVHVTTTLSSASIPALVIFGSPAAAARLGVAHTMSVATRMAVAMRTRIADTP